MSERWVDGKELDEPFAEFQGNSTEKIKSETKKEERKREVNAPDPFGWTVPIPMLSGAGRAY